ncbi:MAG: hypothetical protein WC438_02905 [Candidatus Pacearchaeota archaeon]
MANESIKQGQKENNFPLYIIPLRNIWVNYEGYGIQIKGNKQFEQKGLSLGYLENISYILNKFLKANKRLRIDNIVKNYWTYLTCSEIGKVEKMKTYLGCSSKLVKTLNQSELNTFLKLSGRKSIYSPARASMDVEIIYSGRELSKQNPTPKIVYVPAVGFC